MRFKDELKNITVYVFYICEKKGNSLFILTSKYKHNTSLQIYSLCYNPWSLKVKLYEAKPSTCRCPIICRAWYDDHKIGRRVRVPPGGVQSAASHAGSDPLIPVCVDVGVNTEAGTVWCNVHELCCVRCESILWTVYTRWHHRQDCCCTVSV